MQLTLGFSPCPNDTFILYALMHQQVQTRPFTWHARTEDVETLNNWAMQGKLDVTKMSFSTWLRVKETYALLDSGAALGYKCGPLVVAKTKLSEEEILQGPIAIPGELTTANLLFSLRYPQSVHKIPMVFSEIESAVQSGRVKAGVIIHENRFTYETKGLVKILDLGEFWEEQTGCPIPLGAFAARRALGEKVIHEIEAQIRRSVLYAFENPYETMPYVKSYAQELDEDVIYAHIDTYVNRFSVQLGPEGEKAVKMLEAYATGERFALLPEVG